MIVEKFENLKLKPGKVFKGMFDKYGCLHLDDCGRLFGKRAMLKEFYAHEIAHAIDGHRQLSGTKEWRQAWQAEMADGGYLGTNSAKNPHEGWGDFGMLLLGSGISAKEIKEVMPRAIEFWEKKGLI